MPHPILRLFDGFDNTSPDLRGEVAVLQTALEKAGLLAAINGHFDSDTEAAVKKYQLDHNLLEDGIAGPRTWASLLGTEPPDAATHIPTTFSPDNPSLNADLTEAMKYKAAVEAAAAKFGFAASIIGAIGSRESRWGLALKPPGPGGTGDFAQRPPNSFRSGGLPPDNGGFGRGLMQIDFDAQEFARTGNWHDPLANIEFGCLVLKQSRELIARKTGLAGSALLRAAIAGYNCGPGRVLRALASAPPLDVDFFTAHRDYSADVVNRAGFFHLKGWS